jgi:hypothetical protein
VLRFEKADFLTFPVMKIFVFFSIDIKFIVHKMGVFFTGRVIAFVAMCRSRCGQLRFMLPLQRIQPL